MSLIKHCPDCEKPVEASASTCTHCGADLEFAGRGTSVWLKLQERLSEATTRYEIERLIGYGGMAGVYLAWDKRLNRSVALKLISPAVVMDPRMIRRFFQEAQTMAQLSHRHIVQVYDMDERDDLAYISMQYVPGRTLAEVLVDAGEPLPHDLVATWLAQIASALGHAHARSTPVIHRDVKPSNILLNENGDALLTDFGIAKMTGGSNLTRTSHLIGTPAYMSPEQCQGGTLSAASDQYSLGTVAYELLAGVPPFKGPTMVVLQAHGTVEPPDLREQRPDLPEAVTHVVQRMLAKRPEDRWPTMGAVSEEFTKAIQKTVPPRILSKWSRRVHQLAIPTHPDHLTLGTSERLVAQILDGQGHELDDRRVRWSSTDETVAFVSPDGVVAGLGIGSAFIVAQSGHAVTTLELEVRPPSVHQIVVSPPTMEMPTGRSRALQVMCYTRTGDAMEAEPSFESDRPDVVAVTEDGTVTALAPGEATVTVTAGGIAQSVAVRIVAAPVASITISAPGLELEAGSSRRIPVDVMGTDGQMQQNPVLWWDSSDPAVAVVSGTGVVRAVGPGRATVTAAAGDQKASVEVHVRAAGSAAVPGAATDADRGPGGLDWGAPRPSNLDATVVFQESDLPRAGEPHDVPPGRQEREGAAPVGATVMFEGPSAASGAGMAGHAPPPGPPAAGDATFDEPQRTPPFHRVRRRMGLLPPAAQKAVVWGTPAVVLVILVAVLWPTPSPPSVTRVTPFPRDTTVTVGEEFRYRLETEGDEPTQQVAAIWKSSNEGVAAVTEGGLLRAVGSGTATVSVEGEGIAPGTQLFVNVVAPAPTGVLSILGPSQVTAGSGPLTYRLQSPDGRVLDDPSISWQVEPANLATVNASGQLRGNGAGSVRLSATFEGRTATHLVRIVAGSSPDEPDPQPRDIRIARVPSEVTVGTTVRPDAWLVDGDGQRLEGGDLAWTSNNPDVLRQTGPGTFQASAAGEATLAVSSAATSIRRYATVAVVPAEDPVDPRVAVRVAIAPREVAVAVGGGEDLTATAVNASGGAIDGPSLSWSTQDASVATVTAGGRVEGVAPGSTWVAVGAGGVRDSVPIRVTGVAPPSGEDGRREAARYFTFLRNGNAAALRALVPTDARDRHREFLELVDGGRLEVTGPAADVVVDGDRIAFALPLRRRTNFGNALEGRVSFVGTLTQADGGWQMTSCVIAPGSNLP